MIISCSTSYSKAKMFHYINHLGTILMIFTPCSPCRKSDWLTSYENYCFIARTSITESLLIGDAIMKGLTWYKGTWYKYFPYSFNISISTDYTEIVFWRALDLQHMPYLTNIIIFCGTNNICNDFPCDTTKCLIDIDLCFQNCSPKVKLFISRILPR